MKLSTYELLGTLLTLVTIVSGTLIFIDSKYGTKEVQAADHATISRLAKRTRSLSHGYTEISVNLRSLMKANGLEYQEVPEPEEN